MGEGPNRDGIMLLLSMDDRDWAMFCYGSHCEYAFNSYGQQKLEKVTANAYISDTLQLTEKTDCFTHKTTSRRKIERSSSGGGSSHSESGGGGSGRSGKF